MEVSASVKGILKMNDSSVIRRNSCKVAKFDELNVLATFHPADKDYGHMIIDEPKTPFVFDDDISHELDTETLMEKLRLAAQSETPAFGMDNDSDDSSDDEDYPESIDEKVHRMEFERRRRLHYKEFMSVPLARRLIAEEFGEKGIETSMSTDVFESCIPEVCTPEQEGMEDETMDDQSSTKAVHSTVTMDDYTPPKYDVEPGMDPSHRCYHKIMADLYGSDFKTSLVQDEGDGAEKMAEPPVPDVPEETVKKSSMRQSAMSITQGNNKPQTKPRKPSTNSNC